MTDHNQIVNVYLKEVQPLTKASSEQFSVTISFLFLFYVWSNA